MGRITHRAAALATLALAGALGGCAGGRPAEAPSPGVAPPAPSESIRLWPVTAEIVRACQDAEAQVRYPVLCPSVLPRATRGLDAAFRPHPLRVAFARPDLIDVGYGGGYEDGDLGRNHPRRFLHVEVGRARGLPANAAPARLGGRRGRYAPAVSAGLGGQGPYYGNHVSFVWRQGGFRYVATLHAFGPGTRALLGRIVAGLRPASELRPPGVGTGPGIAAAPIEPGPVGVAVGDGVWVATHGSVTGPARLTRIDPQTLRPSARPHLPTYETGVAIGEGAVWATRPLARIDPRSGRVLARITLAGARRFVDVAAGAGRVWVATNGYGPTAGRAHVYRVDPDRDRVVGRTPLTGPLTAVATTGAAAWVVDAANERARRIDPRTGLVTASAPVGALPSDIVAGHGSLWVTNAGGRTVTRIDAESGAVQATITVGDAPRGVAVDARGVWVVTTGSGELVQIDPATSRLVRRISLGGDPLALASDGRHLWVGMSSDALLVRVDPEVAPARLDARRG